MTTRRGFFGALAALAVGVVSAATAKPSCTFNRQPDVIHDKETGISIRFIRSFDVNSIRIVSRMDSFYGLSEVGPL